MFSVSIALTAQKIQYTLYKYSLYISSLISTKATTAVMSNLYQTMGHFRNFPVAEAALVVSYRQRPGTTASSPFGLRQIRGPDHSAVFAAFRAWFRSFQTVWPNSPQSLGHTFWKVIFAAYGHFPASLVHLVPNFSIGRNSHHPSNQKYCSVQNATKHNELNRVTFCRDTC